MNIKNFTAGEAIFRQGEFSNCMYEILSGKVGIFADSGTEAEKQIATLEAGDFLGELGLIDYYPRSATAIATEDGTQLCEITDEEFSAYLKDNPEKTLRIMKQISHRLRETTANYAEVCNVLSGASQPNQSGEDKEGWLQSKLNFFSDVYRSMMQID